jgi:membrane protein
MQIPGLRGLSPFKVIKDSIKDFLDDDMLTYASALSYQVLFSIFPFFVFLISLLGFLGHPEFFEWLRMQAQYVVPGEAMDQVNRIIEEVQKPQGGLLSIGAIMALWLASAAVRAIMNALNTAYDVPEGRPAWKLYPMSIVYTLGIALMLVAAALLMIVGPQAVQWVGHYVGLEQAFVTIWAWVRWPLAFVLLCLAVAVVYYVAPDVEQEFRFITPGALLAVLVWILASVGFKYYVTSFADYNATYGSIGTVIILLLYFFISAAVLLFGAEINSVIEHNMPSGKNPGQKEIPK